LAHYDGNVFTYQPVGENAAGPSPVTFTPAGGGRARSVLVENLDRDGLGQPTGLGTFTRAGPGQ
jgi:hypothetical protein